MRRSVAHSVADDADLAAEFHRRLNGSLRPDELRPGSKPVLFWPAALGHELGGGACASNGALVASDAQWPQAGDVWFSDSRPVWWKCPKGSDHEWRSAAHSARTTGSRPPIAWRRGIRRSLGSGTLEERRGDADDDHRTTCRCWWQCDRGHEWQSAPGSRIKRSGDCPHCPRRRRKIALTYRPHLRVLFPSDFE